MKCDAIFVFLISALIIASVSVNASAQYLKSSKSDESINAINNIGDYSLANVELVPEWSIGHFWEYVGDIVFDLDVVLTLGLFIEAKINNLIVEVTEVNENNNEYILKINGDAEGMFYFNGVKLGPTDKLFGNVHIEKNNLAIKELSLTFTGKVFNLVDFDFFITIDFNPAFNFFSFPWDNENSWNAETTASIEIGSKTIDFDYGDIIDQELGCNVSLYDAEEITVPAGTFNSFLLTSDLGSPSELWYAPDVGYLVKINENLTMNDIFVDEFGLKIGKLTLLFDLILDNTNFNPSSSNKPPHTPNVPLGPQNGGIGIEYTYFTSTIDPDNDQLWYMWKWDGDTYSEWLGPFYSGDICEESHIWTKKGGYNVQVKAKDIHGCETTWSDPLPITMPKSRDINRPFFSFLQNHQCLFPILRALLKL